MADQVLNYARPGARPPRSGAWRALSYVALAGTCAAWALVTQRPLVLVVGPDGPRFAPDGLSTLLIGAGVGCGLLGIVSGYLAAARGGPGRRATGVTACALSAAALALFLLWLDS